MLARVSIHESQAKGNSKETFQSAPTGSSEVDLQLQDNENQNSSNLDSDRLGMYQKETFLICLFVSYNFLFHSFSLA